MLHWTIYISFFGVVVLTLLQRDNARAARIVALLTALAGFAVALIGTVQAGAGVNTFCDFAGVPKVFVPVGDDRDRHAHDWKIDFVSSSID